MEVFYTSPWVPVEWIKAHGFEPRGAWFAPHLLSTAVPEGVCAFAHSLVDLAKARPPAALILTTACDQMRRAADAIVAGGASHVFLFNLPATWQTPAARRLYHAELERLGKFLERLGGRPPVNEELAAVMWEYDRRRARLRELSSRASARAGAEAAASFFGDGALDRDSLESEREPPCPRLQLSAPVADKAAPPTPWKGVVVALALVGGPLQPAQWQIFDTIKSAGGRVALNATEPGERCLLPLLPNLAPGQNPRTALANHYFDHHMDVYQRPNTRIYAWLGARLAERGVRGIVLWVHVGCDLWRAEAASLREAFRLPVLVLESLEAGAGGPRDANRLSAFIESLQ